MVKINRQNNPYKWVNLHLPIYGEGLSLIQKTPTLSFFLVKLLSIFKEKNARKSIWFSLYLEMEHGIKSKAIDVVFIVNKGDVGNFFLLDTQDIFSCTWIKLNYTLYLILISCICSNEPFRSFTFLVIL